MSRFRVDPQIWYCWGKGHEQSKLPLQTNPINRSPFCPNCSIIQTLPHSWEGGSRNNCLLSLIFFTILLNPKNSLYTGIPSHLSYKKANISLISCMYFNSIHGIFNM